MSNILIENNIPTPYALYNMDPSEAKEWIDKVHTMLDSAYDLYFRNIKGSKTAGKDVRVMSNYLSKAYKEFRAGLLYYEAKRRSN